MKLKPIKANTTEVITNNKRILFSYETPVAYEDIEHGGYYITEKKWSKTTTRHINQWIPSDRLGVGLVPQEDLDNLNADIC